MTVPVSRDRDRRRDRDRVGGAPPLAGLLAGLLLALPGPAAAHSGKTASDVEISVDGSHVRVEILVPLADLDGVIFLDTDADGTISRAEGEEIRRNVVDFARRTWETTARPAALEFAVGEAECSAPFPIALAALADARLLISLEYRSGEPPRSIRIAARFPEGPTRHEPHECRVRIRWGGTEEEAVLVGPQHLEFARATPATGAPAGDAGSGPGTRDVLAALARSLTFWGLALGLVALSTDPRDAARTAAGFAAGLAVGLALLPGRLVLSGPAASALPALALAYVGAEDGLLDRSAWRWALAAAAGACQGLALSPGAPAGPAGALAAAGAGLAAAFLLGAGVSTVRRARPAFAAGPMRLAISIALALAGVVLAVGHGTGRL